MARTAVLGVLAAAWLAALPGPGRSQQAPPDRLAALQREAEALARDERTLLTELRQLEVERDLKAEERRRIDAELTLVGQQRAEAVGRIAAIEAQVAQQRPGVKARLVDLYKLGRPGYLRLLLDVEGVRAVARAYRTVSAQMEADRRRLGEFRRSVDELRATERALRERTQRLEALQAQAQAAQRAAERAVARHDALIAQIDGRRDLNARLTGELQAAQQRLAALEPSAAEAREASEASTFVPIGPLRGSLDWPASGRLTARFGPRRDPRFGTTVVRAGIEIAAGSGAPALAVHDGVVAWAEPFVGFGNLVIVDHGRQAYSLYGYLDSVAVARGMRVARGDAVGSVGRTPAGKPCLYFELRIDGKPVDPVQWLKKR
jgi:septal ring factor EnvC (AmiA/AmiB activator)